MAIKRSIVLTIIIAIIAAGAASLYGVSRQAKLGVYRELETLTTPDVSAERTPLAAADGDNGVAALKNSEQQEPQVLPSNLPKDNAVPENEVAPEIEPTKINEVPGAITPKAMQDKSELPVVDVSPTVATGTNPLFLLGLAIVFGLGVTGLTLAPILVVRR